MERIETVKKAIIYQIDAKFSRVQPSQKKLRFLMQDRAATHLNIWYPPIVHLPPTDDAQRAHSFVHRLLLAEHIAS